MGEAKIANLVSVLGIETPGNVRGPDRHRRNPGLESELFCFGGAHLATALFAGLLVMLAGFEDLQNSFALNFLLETLQRFFERLIFSDLYFWH